MIHKYSMNGYHIVLDVHSGAVHVVDDVLYQMLDVIADSMGELKEELPAGSCPEKIQKAMPGYSPEAIQDAYDEIRELYENGILFSADDYEQYANMMVASPIKAMCLHVAHDCNLRCKYCFAATGEYGGHRALMSAETGKKAIDFLLKYSQGRHNLELDFFGGEPTMNFDVVKEVVAYARSKEKEYNKNFRFTVTTNGILLDDDKIDFINREMSNVVLSLDGRREINDAIRPTSNGKGSYDIIVPKFQKLVEERRKNDDDRNQYYVRGTFTKHNLDFGKDVLHMNELGFDQVSVEPVVSPEYEDYAITEQDLPRIFEEYENLAKEMIRLKKAGKGFNFFHFMIDLNQGPCAIKRLRGCGCGNEYVAVTPEGDVYPCHQFVGMEDWKMGSVQDLSVDFKKKDYFAKTNVYTKEDCKTCWAKFYCSGGCNANSLQYAGDVRKSHRISCELEKKRLECAIMIKAAMADED
ncbi:MAG: thioether cross-link-forming SCIFF peptide maturase [Massiliimalia sp.]|jgi:uncharacterized protein